MYATLIENKPKTYTRPTLIANNFTNIVVSEPSEDPSSEDESGLIIEYKFDNNPNNSHSGYDLTPVGSIQYNTSLNSVKLDGINQYFSVDIDFEVKTLSFWFNLPYVNIDNYLLSFDSDFYIKVNSNSLEFQSCNITQTFSADKWYNLALTSNNANYDIYLDNTKLLETILYKDLSSSTLNIGKYDDKNEIEIDTDHSGIRKFNTGCNMKEHTMVAIDDHMYVFGGSLMVSVFAGDNYFNDLYKIDTDGNFATVILSGVIPPARSQHSMVVIDSNIYIFGGYSSSYVQNDLYKIDTTNSNSEKITLRGSDSDSDIPSKRYSHSMVVIGDDIYIFGGFYESYKNDLYRIDNLGSCEKITLTGSDDDKPSSRHFHSMVVIDNNMYIFGGFTDSGVLNDLYKINTTGNSEKINITGDIPARYRHTMVAIGDYMYIFGGDGDSGLSPNDLYRIDTTGYSKKITLTGSDIPSRRYGHSMVVIDDNIYIFGGIDSSELDDLVKIPFKTHYLNGKIAHLRLYNTLQTVDELHSIYLLNNAEFLIDIYYNFIDGKETNGKTNYDLSSYGSPNFDNKVELDGIDQYLSVDIDFEVKTLSFWFYLTDVNTDNYLLSFDSNFYIKVNSNSLDFQNCNITQTFSADEWYNLALTYNNANYDIYLDNTKLSETLLYKDLSSPTLNIGKYDDENEIEIDTENIETNDIGLGGIYAHTMVAIDSSSNMYIFGGYNGDHSSNLYKIDTDGNFATVILSGVIPPARSQHSMVVIDSNIYIFGGYSSSYVQNDLYKIDTTNSNSEKITLTGDIPTSRSYHSMVAISSNIYIFGGSYGSYTAIPNDLYKIDTSTNSSQKIALSGIDGNESNIPSARRSHSMVAIGSNMYIFGGYDGSFNKDLYKIDTTNNYNSVKINVTGRMESIIKDFSMVAIDNYMYIFGGLDIDQNYSSNLYKIDTGGNSEKFSLSGSDRSSERYSHTMVAIGNYMYIYGGHNGRILDDLVKIPFTFKTHYLNGKIAHLRLYNTLQTVHELNNIYLLNNAEFPISIYYDFANDKETNGNTNYDLRSYGSSITFNNKVEVELDGINQYFSVDIDFEVKTLSFWFNLPYVNIDNYLLSFDSDFYIKVNSNSLEFQSCNITQTFSADKWYNLALTSNNANYDIYLDNTKLLETIRYKDLSSSTLNIGKYDDKIEILQYLDGKIADLRLYNYPLTDISTIYYEFFNTIPLTTY